MKSEDGIVFVLSHLLVDIAGALSAQNERMDTVVVADGHNNWRNRLVAKNNYQYMLF